MVMLLARSCAGMARANGQYGLSRWRRTSVMRKVRIHVSSAVEQAASMFLTCILCIPWEIMVMTLTEVLWHGHSPGMC
eukprot:16315646-Heterocapsa_arctica.AAC.1